MGWGWRWGSGPVFGVAWRRLSRGRGLYAGRAGAVALALGLLASLMLATPTAVRSMLGPRLMWIAYHVVLAIELALAVGLAPALTAGAVAEERRKRRLDDLLVTGLEPRDLLLGKLGSGLAGLVTVGAAPLPILLIAGLLGGVDPARVVAGSVVVLGVAALGASLAILFSIRARRSSEAMALAVSGLIVLGQAAHAWAYYFGPPPLAIRATDVRALLFGVAAAGFSIEWFAFMAVSVLGSAALMGVASRMLRPDGSSWADRSGDRSSRRLHALPDPRGDQGERPRRISAGLRGLAATARGIDAIGRSAARVGDRFDLLVGRRIGMPAPTLDEAPVFWRAWRRGDSAGVRLVWLVYMVASIGYAAAYLDHWQVAMVNGYLVSAGILLVGLLAATAWEDERGQGGFIPLLTTPLSSLEIVRGKWWGTYRMVPRLAVLPGLIVFLRALIWGQPLAAVPLAVAAGGLVLAYGAVATGVGLLIGLREPRPGRAIAWTLAILLAADVAWPLFWSVVMGIPLIRANRWIDLPLAWVSPWMATYLTTAWALFLRREPELYPYAAAIPAWIATVGGIGWVLRRSIERGFDRATGRMPDAPAPIDLATPAASGLLRLEIKA